MPNESSSLSQMYYSYDIKNIHIISLNSEIYLNNLFNNSNYIDKFKKWLIDDLRENFNKTWKIAHMHRPMYCSKETEGCNVDSKGLRNIIEDIFYQYKVNLVVSGHEHNYER